jgi:putative peptide zinc metalloprotease protein
VQLSGQLEDSAFQQQQWLAQRDGQFIQLTELLYRTLEHLDGRRSLAEIAESLARSTGKPITEEDVRQLVAKVIPLGLVPTAEGKIAAPAASSQAQAARSPLGVNMRLALVSPRLVDPLLSVLRVLFLPPVVVAVLVGSAAAHAWLYFVHGIAHGVRDVLYQPGLLLAVIGALILSAAFHEMGHGAALRYGGRRVRGMGAGLYLIYPVFYTDVTENYALGRAARLRTDLGGFYFNLLFGLAAVGLYLVFRHEYLLVIAMLVDLEILHQLLPIVRLDGYWVLADLTGVPDFFALMGAFVRGIIPFRRRTAGALPELKWWGKLVFGLYVLTVVPLLLLLLFITIRAFPHVMATAADSLATQTRTLQEGLRGGDAVAGLAAVVQIALVMLTSLGLGVVIFTVLRRGLVTLWRWGGTSPARRAISSLGSAATFALLVYLWFPQLPFSLPGLRPGGLAALAGRFEPIPAQARGTIGEAVPALGSVLRGSGAPEQSGDPAQATATAAPTGSPGPSPTQSPVRTPTASPSPTRTP